MFFCIIKTMAEEYISKYTESGGLTIAYQIWGDAEDTLMYVPGTISHLEAALEDKEYLCLLYTSDAADE